MRWLLFSFLILYVVAALGYGIGALVKRIREKRPPRDPFVFVTECNPWACWTCHVRGHRLSDCHQHANENPGHVASRLDVYLLARRKGVTS